MNLSPALSAFLSTFVLRPPQAARDGIEADNCAPGAERITDRSCYADAPFRYELVRSEVELAPEDDGDLQGPPGIYLAGMTEGVAAAWGFM